MAVVVVGVGCHVGCIRCCGTQSLLLGGTFVTSDEDLAAFIPIRVARCVRALRFVRVVWPMLGHHRCTRDQQWAVNWLSLADFPLHVPSFADR